MDKQSAGRPLGRVGLVAGVMLLLMAGLAGFGYVVAVDGLVTEGDAARTTQDLMASQSVFGAGILSQAGVIALDVLVAWALYLFFKPVSRTVAMVGAVLRNVYAAVYAVALSQLVGVLGLLNSSSTAVSGGGDLPGQVMAGITRFTDIWDVGLILFGLYLLILGWLGFRSGYVPKVVGVLLAIAGLGYVVDSVGALASSGPWTDVSTYTFVGEFVFALWLVIRGSRVRTGDRHAVDDTAPHPLQGSPIGAGR